MLLGQVTGSAPFFRAAFPTGDTNLGLFPITPQAILHNAMD